MLPAPTSANVQHLHLDSNGNSSTTSATNAQQQQQHQSLHSQQQQRQSSLSPLPAPHQQLQQHRTNKRSSSMIFRIEHLLPMSATSGVEPTTSRATCHIGATPRATAASSNGTSSVAAAPTATGKRAKQRATRSGVYMSQFTPKDTVSEALPTFMLMNSSSNGNSAGPASGRGSSSSGIESPAAAACCTLAQGVLRMSPALLRRIKLSEDIHSYNALFELQGSSVRVRLVRDIARDEELVAWFGEQTSLLMAIPFLTPLNIQGNKRYMCHLCHLTFETPNPLKIHLALGCGRQSMDILWIRLHYALKANAYTEQQQQLDLQQQQLHLQQQQYQQQSSQQQLPPQRTRTSVTPPATSQHSPAPPNSSHSSVSPVASPQPPHTTLATLQQQQQHVPMTALHALPPRFSAFKPVSPSIAFTSAAPAPTSCTTTTISGHSFAALHTTNALTCSGPLPFLPPLSVASSSLPHLGLLQTATVGVNPLNAAAQIEAIVSNMGASKQGHLCIYCGKVYSRKYGLKIHIRTHTGFKPLKCKFCLRPFGDPSNLNKHIRLHLQSNASTATIEGYKCTLCNKTLARRRDLQRHMESRHAEESTTIASTSAATATATRT